MTGQELLNYIREHRRVEAELDRQFHTYHQLSVVKVLVLRELADNETLKLVDLARAAHTVAHNITGLVQRMERDGLVSVGHRPGDKRAKYARLTIAGNKLAAELDEILEKVAAGMGDFPTAGKAF